MIQNDLIAGRSSGVLLTVPEAAKLLVRVSRNLAYDLVARGELPSLRLGRVIRIPTQALLEWLQRQSNESLSRERRGSFKSP